MARVNVSEAAKLAGYTRSHFYRKYINQGIVTVSTDNSGKKYVETSELIRVFGKLETDTEDSVDSKHKKDTGSPENTELLIALGEFKAEKKHLEAQLSAASEREAFYQKQITELTNTIKLLEAPKHPQHPRRWYQFWK